MGITKSSVADSRPPHASRNPHAGDNYRASGLVHRGFGGLAIWGRLLRPMRCGCAENGLPAQSCVAKLDGQLFAVPRCSEMPAPTGLGFPSGSFRG